RLTFYVLNTLVSSAFMRLNHILYDWKLPSSARVEIDFHSPLISHLNGLQSNSAYRYLFS
ncbi:MAG TPA: hypothetical protein VGN44_18500, partial [Candidatus Angelobacter sp.]